MRKTLKDLAKYLQNILLPEARDEACALKPIFEAAVNSENIWDGIFAFRGFLNRLYNVLQTEGDAYDSSKKVAHEYENRTTLSVYYPFLHNINSMLIKIGYYGLPAENARSFICGNTIFNEKLPVFKSLECLRFLGSCGIFTDGIDMNDNKQNLSDIKTIKISYPDNPDMLTGMKVMAIAEIDHRTLVNQDVFLRCDYRALKKDEPDVLTIVRDTITPLSADVQDFILQLHQRYTGKGLACSVEVKGFHIYIKYCYKRKALWGVNASLNNGYHINVKAAKTHEYTDVVKTFPPFLREIIEKGYGCGRKRGVGHCDGGCRGLIIPLDDSVLDMRDDIVTWFDKELTCL